MDVDDFRIAFAGAGFDAVKDEFLRAGNFEQSEIFQRRADENQIVVLGIVEREQAATLDAQVAMESVEERVEFVDGDDFADAGVVIEDRAVAAVPLCDRSNGGRLRVGR